MCTDAPDFNLAEALTFLVHALQSLDTIAAARRRAVKTRGHQAQDLSAMTTLKPCRKHGQETFQKHETKGKSTFSRAYS